MVLGPAQAARGDGARPEEGGRKEDSPLIAGHPREIVTPFSLSFDNFAMDPALLRTVSLRGSQFIHTF